jgi:hypothetical protein
MSSNDIDALEVSSKKEAFANSLMARQIIDEIFNNVSIAIFDRDRDLESESDSDSDSKGPQETSEIDSDFSNNGFFDDGLDEDIEEEEKVSINQINKLVKQ